MAVKSLVHFYTVVRLMKPTAVGFISLTTVLKVIQQIYTPQKKQHKNKQTKNKQTKKKETKHNNNNNKNKNKQTI